MSEHNRALFASQIIPVTKRILDAIDDLFKEEVDSMEKDARKDRILRVTSSCKHGLEVLGDLCLPPVKPRWADLTDAADVIVRGATAGKVKPKGQTRQFLMLLWMAQL